MARRCLRTGSGIITGLSNYHPFIMLDPNQMIVPSSAMPANTAADPSRHKAKAHTGSVIMLRQSHCHSEAEEPGWRDPVWD